LPGNLTEVKDVKPSPTIQQSTTKWKHSEIIDEGNKGRGGHHHMEWVFRDIGHGNESACAGELR